MTDESLESRLKVMEDRAAIIEMVCRFAVCIDQRRWDEFAACFTDEIEVDLIRTNGWTRFDRQEFIGRISKVFSTYTSTQHLSANHQVEISGTTAVVQSSLNATHYMKDEPGGEFHQQVGYYEYHLEDVGGWKISKVKQILHWQRGNQSIYDRTLS